MHKGRVGCTLGFIPSQSLTCWFWHHIGADSRDKKDSEVACCEPFGVLRALQGFFPSLCPIILSGLWPVSVKYRAEEGCLDTDLLPHWTLRLWLSLELSWAGQ